MIHQNTAELNLRFIDVATLWYSVKIMKIIFIILFTFFLIPGSSCTASQNNQTLHTQPEQSQHSSCLSCHSLIHPDKKHSQDCTLCHLGNPAAQEKTNAHTGLLLHPASPKNMVKVCKECHAKQIAGCQDSVHYTLKHAINAVRQHFGMNRQLDKLTEIPTKNNHITTETLVNDMLRRQCLRCHVYSSGDDYPLVKRGTGCAACHMQFTNGKLDSHDFISPGLRQCLSCHYANHVGSDFIGSYEHDFNWEYRTPYTTKGPFSRPYGVEQHDLVSDIHQKRGFTCLDCHTGKELAGQQPAVTCASCHDPAAGQLSLPNLKVNNGKYILTTRDKVEHEIPLPVHPAHVQYSGKVDCQVCHGQWGFNDRPTHLLRSLDDDVDPWERLTVQSNSTVERILEHNLYSDEDELSLTMQDTITGHPLPGIWYQGYTSRRWEKLIIKMDTDGVIKVFRPLLDLHLSAVDENGSVIIDNFTGIDSGLRPYTPHTTGPAGLFFEQRFQHLLNTDTKTPKTLH